MKATHGLAFVLVIIGGLNWLLVGLFTWDIGVIFGGPTAFISKVIYILVGLSAIYLIATHKKYCKHCEKKEMPASTPNTPSSNPM